MRRHDAGDGDEYWLCDACCKLLGKYEKRVKKVVSSCEHYKWTYWSNLCFYCNFKKCPSGFNPELCYFEKQGRLEVVHISPTLIAILVSAEHYYRT